jgi:predicted nucleic acid-binding protein
MLVNIYDKPFGNISIDNDESILHMIVKEHEECSGDNLIEALTVFSTVIDEAYKNHKRYYVLFDLRNMGLYPPQYYFKIKDLLDKLKPKMVSVIHASGLLVTERASRLLELIFSLYTPIRPSIVKDNSDDILTFFNDPKNINTNDF